MQPPWTSKSLTWRPPMALPPLKSTILCETNSALPYQGAAHIWLPLLWCRLRWSVLPGESQTLAKPCWTEGWFCTPIPGSADWETCRHFPTSEVPSLLPGEIQSWQDETLNLLGLFYCPKTSGQNQEMNNLLCIISNTLTLTHVSN